MLSQPSSTADTADWFFEKTELQKLLERLWNRQYRVLGPIIDQDAIVYDELRSIDQLPRGWTDDQHPGQYRLKRRTDDAWFGYNVGPHSWKKYLFPPKAVLLTAQKTEHGWAFLPPALDAGKMAFIGVRACELAALRTQDRIFLEGPFRDPLYCARREHLFVVAVQCTQAGANCFCSSMKTGPECRTGFDIALTEIPSGFLAQAGTDDGAEILETLQIRPATLTERDEGARARQQASDMMTKAMNTDEIQPLLMSQLNHPRWKSVGERCLSCTNCTMVCPTCFCSSVTEVRDLCTGDIERERSWDSCFNPDFSYLGGSPVRNETSARYRQWLTHKLAGWHDQFGTSGCVGCGRCITWCPVGIDLTEEVAAIRESTPA